MLAIILFCLCVESVFTEMSLQRLRKDHHFQCTCCRIAVMRRGQLREHIYIHHIPPARWPFKCRLEACEFYCKYQSEYASHAQSQSHLTNKSLRPEVDDQQPKINPNYQFLEERAYTKVIMTAMPSEPGPNRQLVARIVPRPKYPCRKGFTPSNLESSSSGKGAAKNSDEV